MSLIDELGRGVSLGGAGMVFSTAKFSAFQPVAEWLAEESPRVANLPPNGILYYAGRIYDVNAEGHVVWSREWPDEITIHAGIEESGALGKAWVLAKPSAPAPDAPLDWSQPLGADDVAIVGLEEDPQHPGLVTAVFEVVNADHPAAHAIALYWSDTAVPQPVGHPMQDLGPQYTIPARGAGQPEVAPSGRRRWRMRSNYRDSHNWHVRAPGEGKPNIALRYQLTGPAELPDGGHVTYPDRAFVDETYPDLPPMTQEYQSEWTSPWSASRWKFTVPADFFKMPGEPPAPRPDPLPSIADLFPGAGLWHDLSDRSTLFEDASAGLPAAIDGPVRRINDKSGNGHDLVAQANGVGTYREDDGRRFVELEGFRWEPLDARGMLRNVEAVTVMVVAEPAPEGAANDDAIVFFTAERGTNGRVDLRYINGVPRLGSRHPTSGAGRYIHWRSEVRRPAVLEAVIDFAAGTMSLSVNGEDPVEGSLSGAGNTPDADATRVTYFGSASTGSPFLGRFYGGFVVPRRLTGKERQGAREELEQLCDGRRSPGMPDAGSGDMAPSVPDLGEDDQIDRPDKPVAPVEPGIPGNPGGKGDEGPGDYTVHSTAELRDAIADAPGGSVIAIAPGIYGGIAPSGRLVKDRAIRLRPVDRSDPPVWTTSRAIDFRNVEGIIFDGLSFRGETGADGFPTGYCMHIHHSKRLAFRNCEWVGYHATLASSFTEDVTFEWCRFTGTGMDYLRIYESHRNFTVRHCYFGQANVNTLRAHESSRHPDIMQLACNEVNNGEGMDGFLVENNVIYGGPVQQCIFMHNERAARGNFNYVHRNLTVRGNYIESRHIHGIHCGGTQDFRIEGNLLRRAPESDGSQVQTPAINFQTGYNRNGIVRNNVTPQKIGAPSWTGDCTDVKFESNLVSDTAVPDGWVMPIVGPYNQLK